MPWIKLDVNFLEHPKIDSLSCDAKLLHLWALLYSGRQLTDGFIPLKQVAEKPHLVTELVTALLWHDVTGGYEIHDYLKHQSSRGQVKGAQETTRKRVAKHRVTHDVTPLLTPDVLALEVEVEVEVEVEQKIKDNSKPVGFDEFWEIYPIHNGGKPVAERALKKALKKVTLGVILEGARKYRDDPNRSKEFTAYSATWLNQGRWDDPPLPPQSLKTGVRGLVTTPTVIPPRFQESERPKRLPVPENLKELRGGV